TRYLGYLAGLRATVTKTAVAQHSSLLWHHPDPDTLWTLAGGHRMWERQTVDPDFCHVRVGTGIQPLVTRLVPPASESAERADPVTGSALRRFLQTHSTVKDVPIAIDLRQVHAVTVDGATPQARALIRAMICQLAVLHSPTLLRIAAVSSDRYGVDWEWLKWLPHNQHPRVDDQLGSVRLVYPSVAAAEGELAGLSTPVAIVVD